MDDVRDEVADGIESVADMIRGKKDKKPKDKKEKSILSADPVSATTEITPEIRRRRH